MNALPREVTHTVPSRSKPNNRHRSRITQRRYPYELSMMREQPEEPATPFDGALSPASTQESPCLSDLDHRMMSLVSALLRSPSLVLTGLARGEPMTQRLVRVIGFTMLISGATAACFSGGAQWLLTPLKVTLGMFFAAALCLPSLYIFSCLGGGRQSVHQTWAAFLMGLALTGILMVGLAPILWLFSQTTNSETLIGAMHIGVLLFSLYCGLSLTRKALQAMNEQWSWAGFSSWAALFTLVILQLTTTLRPLIGPFDGHLTHERMFFLIHWSRSLLRGL